MKARKIKIVSILLILAMVAALAGCGLSGTYESAGGTYAVEFKANNECTWYQDGLSFDGTYEKAEDGYRLDMRGTGDYRDTTFYAVFDGKDLIITGGTISGERFSKK